MVKKISKNKCIIFLLPSLIGFSLFYLIPFIMAFYYTVMGQGEEPDFVGITHYITLFNNDIFRNALKNTIIFIGISVPFSIGISLMIAMGIKLLYKQKRLLQCMVLMPMVVPAASISFFWKSFFSLNGTLNGMLEIIGIEAIDWLNCRYAIGVMVFIFVWKNVGYNTILFIAGLYNIPNTYYESANIDGASSIDKFKYITWIYLVPTTFLVFIMSIINSFKVFKEIYLIAGPYPHESIYMLQHYMNNMFMSLNYQKLSTSAYILVIFILMLLGILFLGKRSRRNEE